MNFEKALALYRNDKTLQILRADHFPLLVSFFHLAFKQQERIAYPQSDLAGLLGDFLFSLERQDISEYNKPPLDYLQKWAQQGYLRRYYETADEPVYELRTCYKQVKSVMMDRFTFDKFEGFAVTGERNNADKLQLLNEEEANLYAFLKSRQNNRLEQEKISQDYVEAVFSQLSMY